MKTRFILLLAFVGLAFVGCSNTPKPATTRITGPTTRLDSDRTEVRDSTRTITITPLPPKSDRIYLVPPLDAPQQENNPCAKYPK